MKRKGKKARMKPVIIAIEAPDMLVQEIANTDPDGKVFARCYVARPYGSRECWIDERVLSEAVRQRVPKTPSVWRWLEVRGQFIGVVSIAWLLEHHKVSSRERQWFEGISTAFDRDNSRGQRNGECFYRNP